MGMAIQAVGGTAAISGAIPVSSTAQANAAGGVKSADSAASTVVISRVTVTNSDGSTTTTITYADGHTETETTPPQPGAERAASGESRVTAVNLLA
jgi:hypothetical protein